MNDDDQPADRIISFTLGVSIAAVCAFFAWAAFALLTMMMNPKLAEADYWSAVDDRAESNPLLAGAAVLFRAGTVLGVVLMALAVVRRLGVK